VKSSVELLAPAGDLEKLKTALDFGADAVYAGGNQFSLRAFAANFPLADLAKARELTLARNKKFYLTLNAYLLPDEIEAFGRYLDDLRSLDIDAYIVSDPGVLALLRDLDPDRPIHLSTQANTTNPMAIRFWQQQGVARINLARELTLEEIRRISSDCKVELETFIHGSLCVAYSGRCLLSAAMTGRSANRGACTHPCRWQYTVQEESRPGQHFPIEEDARGTYLFNSRDLCLIEFLPELIQAGVTALKIEGRMKSRYYVGAVTRIYRAALDLYLADPPGYRYDPAWLDELEKVSHRPYGTGFLFGRNEAGLDPDDRGYLRTHDFVGVVTEAGPDHQRLVDVRNRFFPGELLELIGPGMRQESFRVETLAGADGHLAVAQPNSRVSMELPLSARPGDLLRRARENLSAAIDGP